MNSFIESIVDFLQNNITLVLIVLGVLAIVYIFSLAVIFKKVGQKSLLAFIPIYNVIVLLSVLRIPKWMILLLFIPFINIIGLAFMTVLIGYKLGTICRKNVVMKIGLMFLSPIFYPLLAFTDIDVDGSKIDYVIERPKKQEFKLEPIEIITPVDAPEVMNLSNAEAVDKLTVKKVEKKAVIKKADYSNVSVEEHLAKADKAMPTAEDLTFDYNLIYNAPQAKEKKVEDVANKVDTPVVEIKEEAKVEAVPLEPISDVKDEVEDNTPFIPVVHDVVLEAATPIDNTGPILINQRYENQMRANIETLEKKKEIERSKAKEIEEQIIQKEEPVAIIDNGPINLNSSLSGLIAPTPDFNISHDHKIEKKVEDAVEPQVLTQQPVINEPEKVQEIVSMNIVEPSQLPVTAVSKEETVEVPPSNTTTPQIEQPRGPIFITNNIEPEPLLRPVGGSYGDSAQVDKECPQCHAKVRRDSPGCFICGYRFSDFR